MNYQSSLGYLLCVVINHPIKNKIVNIYMFVLCQY
jgi:hypothetical protein